MNAHSAFSRLFHSPISRLAGAVLLTACISLLVSAKRGPKFVASPPPAGKALVYVYRHSATFSKGGALPVFVNKDYLATLPYSSYAGYAVPAGKVVVTAGSRECCG